MNKELEALGRLAAFVNPSSEDEYSFSQYKEDYNIIRQYIEAIDNANPSEALECLERIREFFLHRTREMSFQDLRDIKQALIKSQEYEKVLKIIFEKRVNFEVFSAFETYEDYEIYYDKKVHLVEHKLTNEEFDTLKIYYNRFIIISTRECEVNK